MGRGVGLDAPDRQFGQQGRSASGAVRRVTRRCPRRQPGCQRNNLAGYGRQGRSRRGRRVARHSELTNVPLVPVRHVGTAGIAGRARRSVSDQGGLAVNSGYPRMTDAIRRSCGNGTVWVVVRSRRADELVHEDQPNTYREQDQQARPRRADRRCPAETVAGACHRGHRSHRSPYPCRLGQLTGWAPSAAGVPRKPCSRMFSGAGRTDGGRGRARSFWVEPDDPATRLFHLREHMLSPGSQPLGGFRNVSGSR